jgi:starch phosphorylase
MRGKDRWRGGLETMEGNILKVTDEALWQLRNSSRDELVTYVRQRFERQLMVSGESRTIVENARRIFNTNTLTLGFARRFVPYKRPDLLLHDEARFIRLLTNTDKPVQLIIAGKAPPFDEPGKALIRKWAQFIQQHNLHNHVVFLSDYDMLLAEKMVQGVDVWINTPRRPWEACGTSGMKVLVNGGINLSELDGWWAEAYTPEVGWAIGDVQEHGEDPAWDAAEAAALYDLLENQVIPEFYNRDQEGIPGRWTKRMRQSMATLAPRFSANRSVREYTEQYYLPAAANYLKRAAEKGSKGISINTSRLELSKKWEKLQFGEVQSESMENGYRFKACIWLQDINPGAVMVQLYAESINGGAPEIINMNPDAVRGKGNELVYHAEVLTARPVGDYTARIIAGYENISVPLEDNLIKWQH